MNRQSLTLGAALALALATVPAQAECMFPKAPASIPDGRSASEPEMIAAMQSFKAYNEAVTEFGTCLEKETLNKAAGTAQLMQLKTMQSKKHNAAVAELEEKARLFNEQVRIFKAKG